MPKMQRYKRAVAVTGTYKNNAGEEKKSYTPVGTLFQYEDGGFALKLDAYPVGEGWISFYDFDEKRDGAQPQAKSSSGAYGGRRQSLPVDGDDIPF